MSTFTDVLGRTARRIPEARLLMVMGSDAIPIERVAPGGESARALEAVAAEYTTALRSAVTASADTGLGALQELTVATERMTALIVSITPEYYLFAALQPQALVGRARYALRLASAELAREFV